jgi:hypothetical protein
VFAGHALPLTLQHPDAKLGRRHSPSKTGVNALFARGAGQKPPAIVMLTVPGRRLNDGPNPVVQSRIPKSGSRFSEKIMLRRTFRRDPIHLDRMMV